MDVLFVDYDVYRYVMQNTRKVGEDPSSILRRLLYLRTPGLRVRRKNPVSKPIPVARDRMALQPHDLTRAIRSAPWLPFDVQRYLYLLGAVARARDDRFPLVQQVRGRTRIYFAGSSEEIARSGTSTLPRRIPGTKYWALTHLPRREKARVLRNVMTLLEFSEVAMLDAREFLLRTYIPTMPY
jgi:negative modulator of initiation of replication